MKQLEAKRVNTQLQRETLSFLAIEAHLTLYILNIWDIIPDAPYYMHAPVRQRRF